MKYLNSNSNLKFNLEITSKNNKVFLIGDESVSKLASVNDNIEFINIEEYEIRKRIVDNEIEFIQKDEKSILITGKNLNSKNNKSVLSLKNS